MVLDRLQFWMLLMCGWMLGGSLQALAAGQAVTEEDWGADLPFTVAELPSVDVWESKVANQQPETTFAMPVSLLRYQPRVDVQERGYAESQADVSVRGGTFESTGFRVGAATLYDPQTGHYFAEIPIAQQMLGLPLVLTGVDNALSGFNSLTATIGWRWLPVQTGGEVAVGAGSHGLNYQNLYAGWVAEQPLLGGRRLGVDVALARSEGKGTLTGGDHTFSRYNARVQLIGDRDQTDLFVGYQAKFFGWPYLYAPREMHQLVGSSGMESENLQTTLVMLNHRIEMTGEDYLELTGYWRRNRDDYDFDRYQPMLFGQPYQHETRVWSGAWDGLFSLGNEDWRIRTTGQFLADSIESTALTFGDYHSRAYYKVSLAPERIWLLNQGWSVAVLAGVSAAGSDRDSLAVSPVARVSVQTVDSAGGEWQVYAEFSKATQLPGYTALKSNPAGGLFRGDPSLGVERGYNYELGFSLNREAWFVESSLFYRQEKDLTDWVYDSAQPPTTSRSGSAVDADTIGWELIGGYRFTTVDWLVGYTYLSKTERYRISGVDASFYSGNYPRHRVTAAVVWRWPHGIEWRLDNEYRLQEPNALRSGTREPLISTIGVYWQPQWVSGLRIGFACDNLWDTRYEQVPGVPGGGRQWVFSANLQF